MTKVSYDYEQERMTFTALVNTSPAGVDVCEQLSLPVSRSAARALASHLNELFPPKLSLPREVFEALPDDYKQLAMREGVKLVDTKPREVDANPLGFLRNPKINIFAEDLESEETDS